MKEKQGIPEKQHRHAEMMTAVVSTGERGDHNNRLAKKQASACSRGADPFYLLAMTMAMKLSLDTWRNALNIKQR